jgi:muconolactone delta-isomerase
MRFLVITKQRHPVHPEQALGLFEAVSGWARGLQASGKIEQAWSFAGLPGGGGIFNVNSLEELDQAMNAFPLGPFTEIEVLPLVDLEPSLESVRGAIRAMTPPAS